VHPNLQQLDKSEIEEPWGGGGAETGKVLVWQRKNEIFMEFFVDFFK